MKHFFIGLGCLLALLSCSGNKTGKGDEALHTHFVVDIKGKSDAALLKETMANISARLVRLESNDSNFIDTESSRLYLTNDWIFVLENAQRYILRYDLTGKFVNKINRKGQGPEEYITTGNIFVNEDAIFISDLRKMQEYDFEGNYKETILPPKKDGQLELGQFSIDSKGRIVQARDYITDSRLMVYDKEGNLLSEYFPTPDNLRNFMYVQGCYYSMGNYEDGIYFTNYFDTNVYLLRNDSVETIATFDFGNMNMPADLLDGTTEEAQGKYLKLRKEDAAILKVDNLVITPDWIVFVPSLRTVKEAVYCHRKSGKYLMNNDFDTPYAALLGGWNGPDGYNSSTGEFYSLVNAGVLKEMLEDLKASDADYQTKYPFLKGIDPKGLDEEGDDWVIFYKM